MASRNRRGRALALNDHGLLECLRPYHDGVHSASNCIMIDFIAGVCDSLISNTLAAGGFVDVPCVSSRIPSSAKGVVGA